MNHRARALAAVAVACLLLGGCKDRHEPLKPTVIDLGIIATA